MIEIYYSYHRGGRREEQTQGVSHISLAQYSTAHIESRGLSVLRSGRGVLLGPFIAWRGVVGPLYPHAQTRSTSLSLGTFQNKHVLAQLGTVQNLLANTGLAMHALKNCVLKTTLRHSLAPAR